MVDRDLFVHNLAVVAIMKDEEPYVKEWLDYHLLAGVDHFYIYDNDSTPEFKKILQPYIDAGIVTYTFFPGKARQYEAYNNAFKNFKFESRYMAWIDGDEFIFPKSKPTISEVVDEVLPKVSFAAALTGNLLNFGSNGHVKADYSRGVLERFTARDARVDNHVSTIANPRKISFFYNPHFAVYFEGCHAVSENGNIVEGPFNDERTVNKIEMHHHHVKSREEYQKKIERGTADGTMQRSMKMFESSEKTCNEVFDDNILKFRDARRAALIPEGSGIEALIATKKINYPKLINALVKNLSPVIREDAPREVFNGKMESFLTCLNLSSHLKKNYFGDDEATLFEEISLNAIQKTLYTGLVTPDLMLLISEMPKILKLKYPVVGKIRELLVKIIPQLMSFLRTQNHWQELTDLTYKLELMKSFGVYKK